MLIPPDFARAYYRGRGARVSFLVDATDPIVARAVQTSAEGLEEVLNRDRGAPRSVPPGPRRPVGARLRDGPGFVVQPELIHRRAWSFSVLTYFNPELRTPVFVVPALLGVILTTTMILMTALSIVRERERGTFEFLIATPVHRFELMLGKISPYVAIGAVQVAIVLLAGLLLFRVPVRGSLLDLGVASLLFIGANLTLGLVISAVTTNQLQATQLAFFFFLPSVLLSGFMFPFDAMPAAGAVAGRAAAADPLRPHHPRRPPPRRRPRRPPRRHLRAAALPRRHPGAGDPAVQEGDRPRPTLPALRGLTGEPAPRRREDPTRQIFQR